jgi:DNA-binding LacI/PurR family transcriptional regulator
VREAVRRGTAVDALFANDEMACAALRALHDAGLRVPEDVAVTGFDDNSDVLYYEPPLTTIRQDYGVLSGRSVEYLLTMIQNPESPHYRQVINPQLIIRQSTQPPAKEAYIAPIR